MGSMAIHQNYLQEAGAELANVDRVSDRCLQILLPLRVQPSSATPAQLFQAIDTLLSAVSMLALAVGHLTVGHENER